MTTSLAAALDRAVELGCNFFDTALAYGNGHSERLLGALVRRHPGHRLYVATKVPPKNWKWPGRGTDAGRRDVSIRPHHRIDGDQPRDRSGWRRWICSSCTCGTTPGRPTTAGSVRRGI